MTTSHLLIHSFVAFACYQISYIVALEAIIGGDKAQVNQFRYQASVQSATLGHDCGGCIIGEQFILSAAHCVLDNDGRFRAYRMLIVAGTNDLRRLQDKSAVAVDVAKVYVPREFVPSDPNDTADIAVLKLKQPLNMSEHRNLARIKLPKNKRELHQGVTATVSGFGWDWIKESWDGTERGGNSDGKLRFAEAVVLGPGELGYPPGRNPQKHICARVTPRNYQPRGVCTGDSGGPLVYGDTVIGIFSKSRAGCLESVFAATYTRVSNYLTFIRNSMKGKVTKHMRMFDWNSTII